MQIRDPVWKKFGSGMEKFGSEIRDTAKRLKEHDAEKTLEIEFKRRRSRQYILIVQSQDSWKKFIADKHFMCIVARSANGNKEGQSTVNDINKKMLEER